MYCVYVYVHIYTHFRKYNLRYVISIHHSFDEELRPFLCVYLGFADRSSLAFLLEPTFITHHPWFPVPVSLKVEQALNIL